MKSVKLYEIWNTETDYKDLFLSTIVFSAFLMAVFIFEIFFVWLVIGTHNADKIEKIWFANLILNYFPLIIISSILLFRINKRKLNKDWVRYKTNLITLLIIIVLYLLRNQIAMLF